MKLNLSISILLLITITSCQDPEEEGDQQSYNIQVVDIFTDEGIEGVEVKLNWNIGAGYPIHGEQNDEGLTDAEGKVNLTTSVDMDSVQAFFETSPWLGDRHIHQSIFIEHVGYTLIELEQDTPIRIFRPSLAEEIPVKAKLLKYIDADLKLIDVAPRRAEDVYFSLDILQFHPNFSFEYYSGGFLFFLEPEPDTMNVRMLLADGVDYRIDYSLATLDTLSETLDTFFQSSYEFIGDASFQSQMEEISF